jgi:type II secretory pathway pseudopilin PulG
LPELLVVLVILVILASALVPVFFTARSAAKAAACISNFRQSYYATSLYLNDYDETYMPVNHQPAGEFNSKSDRTWVQMILPYAPDFGIFRCPADDSDRPRREATFDTDLIPGDTYSQYYTASLRTNVGFNFIYFSPIYEVGDDVWQSEPKIASDVANPDETYLFIDSVWSLDTNGEPTGGGSWLVVPPCRYDQTGSDSFAGDPGIKGVFTYYQTDGWQVDQPVSPLQYGGTWPWHHKTRMTTITANGSARSLTPKQITQGCDLQSNWQGYIEDDQKYKWDLR